MATEPLVTDTSTSAILDLSYRNYDGPIGSVSKRWAVIARAMILKAFRLKSYWTFAIVAGWYYLAMIIILFFIQQIATNNPSAKQGFETFLNGIVWKDQLFHGFAFSQHILLIVTLLVGAGSIANDNRANALLVYLSKPTRKIDYLAGKWIGVFVPVCLVTFIPSAIFYLYGIFSFREQGFLSSDPWLALQLLAVIPVAAAIHTSLILFVSSLFKQGAVAGAVYAGLYFMGYFFSLLILGIQNISDGHLPGWVVKLNFACIDGLITGFARAVIRPGDSRPFGMPAKIPHPIPNPSALPYLVVVLIIISLATWGAWTRIRAVEIV